MILVVEPDQSWVAFLPAAPAAQPPAIPPPPAIQPQPAAAIQPQPAISPSTAKVSNKRKSIEGFSINLMNATVIDEDLRDYIVNMIMAAGCRENEDDNVDDEEARTKLGKIVGNAVKGMFV